MSLKLFQVNCEICFPVLVLAENAEEAHRLTENDFAASESRHMGNQFDCGTAKELTDQKQVPREWGHTLIYADKDEDQVTPEVWFERIANQPPEG